jgi:hypothetical protein
MDVGAS